MEIGYSSSTKLLMKFLSEETKEKIERHIEENRNNKSIDYNFQKDTEEFERNLTDDEYMTIRLYTGTNYKNINAVFRNTWNYEDNSDSSIAGMLTQGFTMGIINMNKKIESYKDTCDSGVVELAEDIVKFQEKEIKNLKEFL